MSNLYLSIKVLHILAIISWMAGMLYLPRLFVYHAEAPKGSPQARTFVVMERRLMRAIMLPALLATWATGLTLAVQAGFLHDGLVSRKIRPGDRPQRAAWIFRKTPERLGGRDKPARLSFFPDR